jgi:hypothetical protein
LPKFRALIYSSYGVANGLRAYVRVRRIAAAETGGT